MADKYTELGAHLRRYASIKTAIEELGIDFGDGTTVNDRCIEMMTRLETLEGEYRRFLKKEYAAVLGVLLDD